MINNQAGNNTAQHAEDGVAFACDLTALTREQRAQHEATTEKLFKAAHELRELPDGYALRFGTEEFPQTAAFVTYERLCCPFLNFEIEVEPGAGPVWLRLRGPAGVKAFLAEVLPFGQAA